MCGIVGVVGTFEPGLVRRMADAIAHRGPDGEGYAEFPDASVAIGMRRLAVIDLVTGDQPMQSADGQVHIVFNGEIYNYRELRRELEARGYRFRTASDTEVVLAAYLTWGRDAWVRLHGMFAIAIVDRRAKGGAVVVLVRDRVGMKPLYVLRSGTRFAFASEIKALLQCAWYSPDVDLSAIRDYLALRYVPGPGSLLKGISKCPAGCELVLRNGQEECVRWWNAPVPICDNRHNGDGRTASEAFGEALRTAVRRHLVADVPVGAFLSGGIDSSAIVALMAEARGVVKTFSIGFPEFSGDETRMAAATASALGTNHTSIECVASDMLDLPDIAAKLDEPIGDAIVVPMGVLSREARKSVTVVLSGEGADEILGGYMFHRKLAQIEFVRSLLPRAVWPAAATLADVLPARLLGAAFDYPGELGGEGRRKIARLLRQVGTDPLSSLYRSAVSLFDSNDVAEACAGGPLAAYANSLAGPRLHEPKDQSALRRLIDYQYSDWLPDDILTKADKMTMAHSLECRIPFMDESVIVAASNLPDRQKLGRNANKFALRAFARNLLPREVVDGPKRAFYVPLESYIEAPSMRKLIAWALAPDRLRRRGLISPEWVARQRAPSSGAGFLPLKRLFSVLMLELWFERFAPDASWA